LATFKAPPNAFETWIKQTFALQGAFTMFLILMKDEPTTLSPLCSSYLHVIGDDVIWSELTETLNGAGVFWDSVATFAGQDEFQQIFADPEAKARLRELEVALLADRLVLQKGELFDRWGRRLQIERTTKLEAVAATECRGR
jgi:hypothetical protein